MKNFRAFLVLFLAINLFLIFDGVVGNATAQDGLTPTTTPTPAVNPSRGQCLREVRSKYTSNVSSLRSQLDVDEGVCKAGDAKRAACMLSCTQSRSSCYKPINDKLSACYTNCDGQFAEASNSCKNQVACGSSCSGNSQYQECMIPSRIELYRCNVRCREAAKSDRPARRLCQTDFRSCSNSCKQIF